MWQQIVEEVDRLPHGEQGIYIPYVWFQHFISEAGLVQRNAMDMLADILWWYRPKRTIDETTGKLIKTDKYFEKDKLHRNYRYWMQRLKLTKKQARLGLAILVEKGLVIVEYRDEMIKGKWHRDRMYVEPVMGNVAGLFEALPEPELPPEIDEADPPEIARTLLEAPEGVTRTTVQVPSETPENLRCPQGHTPMPSRADVDESDSTKERFLSSNSHVDYLGMFEGEGEISLETCQVFLDEIVYPFDAEGNLVSDDGFNPQDPLFLVVKSYTKDAGKVSLQGKDRTKFLALKRECLKNPKFLLWTMRRARANKGKWYLNGLFLAVFDPDKREQFEKGTFVETGEDVDTILERLTGSGKIIKGAGRFKQSSRTFDINRMYAEEFPPDAMDDSERVA